LVHPALWRKPEHKLFNILRDNLIYLEIHSSKDGIKTFSAETRYDWYIYSKKHNGKTIVKFEDDIIELEILATSDKHAKERAEEYFEILEWME
jgi:hypothetical protein